MTIGDLILRVLLNDKGFDADLQKTASKSGDKAGKTLGARMSGGIKGAFKGSKGGLLGMIGIGAGIGVATVALGKLVGFMGDAVDAASNLTEATTKAGTVFDDSAERVEAWAETAALSMGLSKRAALEATGTIGNLLLSMGKTSTEAADMSMKMVQLAADLASFNNVDVEEVLAAMRSGLTGEIAPLRRFGVNLTDVTLKAKAMNLGLYDGKGLLDVNAKSAAAYALILEQTTTAQGDFARTSDGLANTQRSLNASMEDAQAAIGEALLPIMVELVQFVRDELVPLLNDVAEATQATGEAAANNEEPIQNLINLFHDLFKDPEVDARTFLGTLFDGLNDVKGGLDDLASNLNDAWTFWDPYTDAAVDAALALDQARAAANALDMADLSNFAGKTEDDLAGAAAAAADAEAGLMSLGEQGQRAMRKLKVAATTAAESFESYRDRVIDSARDVVDKAYQVIADKAELNAATIEAAELRQVIATGKATSEQKARYRELGETQANLVLDLAANGVIAGKEVDRAMNQIRERLKTATGNERKALLATIAALDKLVRAAERARVKIAAATELARLGLGSSGLIGGNWGPTGHAAGGIAKAGVPAWFGEQGKELGIPLVDTLIVPHEQSMALEAQGAMGKTYNISVMNPEPRAADADIGRMLRRLSALGIT